MQSRKRKGLAAMLAAATGVIGFSYSQHAHAATDTFTNNGASNPASGQPGTGDNQYSTATNWSAGHVAGDTTNGGSAGDTIGMNYQGGFLYLNSPEPNVLDARLGNSGANILNTWYVSNSASLTLVGDAAGLGGNTTGDGFGMGRTQGATMVVNITGGILSTVPDDFTGEFAVGQLANASGFATGVLNMSGGTISTANNFILGDQINTGHRAAGFVTQTAGTIIAGGTAGGGSVIIGNNGNGTYTMSGGVLTQFGTGTNLSGTSNQTSFARVGFYVGRFNGSTGSFSQSGGTVTVSNGLYVADQTNATGMFQYSGGVLTIAGEIRVAPSTVDIDNPAALTGNHGTFSIIGDPMPTITANSLVADTAGSTLNYEITADAGPTVLDLVPASVGTDTLDGTAHLTSSTLVDVETDGIYTPSTNITYVLLTATSITGLPTLVTKNGDPFNSGAWSLAIDNNPDGSESLVLTASAVPEPGSLAAMLLAGGFVVAGRRRKRRV